MTDNDGDSLGFICNFLQARSTDWPTLPVRCLRFSNWPISIHNWKYIFHRVLSDPYSDVLCSEECQTKKLLAVCCKMFAFLNGIFKFCTVKKLFIFDYAVRIRDR